MEINRYDLLEMSNTSCGSDSCVRPSEHNCPMSSIIPHPGWAALHKVLHERRLLKESSRTKDPAARVEKDDFLLAYLLQFVTKETFLAIPLVSRRWGKFRSDDLWKKRTKLDWGLDVSTLNPKPADVSDFYRRLQTAYKETVRRRCSISVLHKNDMTIRLPTMMRERMFSF